MENSWATATRSGEGPRQTACRQDHPNLVAATLDVVMDDGRARTFRAWRSRYDMGFSRALGAVRLVPGDTGDTVDQRAFATAMQAAALRLPYGGACGGVEADAHHLSRGELSRLAWAFVARFPDFGVTRPGGTVLSGWRCRDQRTLRFGLEPGTSHPMTWEEAVGVGAFALIRAACPCPGKWVLHGCDQVSIHLARLLTVAGWKLVGVSDHDTSVCNRWGLPPSELACAMADTTGLASLVGERGTRRAETPFDEQASLVVVAAEQRLSEAAAAELRCRVVVELGLGGVVPKVADILARRGIAVVPEIAATAGGTIFAHLAGLQRRLGLRWSRTDMLSRLAARMQELSGLPPQAMGQDLPAKAVDFIHASRAGGVVTAL